MDDDGFVKTVDFQALCMMRKAVKTVAWSLIDQLPTVATHRLCGVHAADPVNGPA